MRICGISLLSEPLLPGRIAPCDLCARSIANAALKRRSSIERSVHELENMISDARSRRRARKYGTISITGTHWKY